MLSAVTKVITSTNGYCNLLWSSQKYIEKDQLWGAARLSHFVLSFMSQSTVISQKWLHHTCEPVASKMLEKFSGELAKKLENFVGLRYVK